jgi:hypothetical protein
MGEKLENSVMQLNNQMSELKVTLGQEIIPIVIEVTKQITEPISYINNLSPAAKTTIASIGLIAGSLVILGAGVTQAIITISQFKLALEGLKIAEAVKNVGGLSGAFSKLGITLSGLNTSFAGLGAAIPLVAFAAAATALGYIAQKTIEYKEAQSELEQQDIEEALDRQAEALKKLQEAFPGATNAQMAYNEAVKKGLDNIIKEVNGIEKLNKLLDSLTNSELALTEKRSQAQNRLNEINKTAQNGYIDLDMMSERSSLQAEIADVDKRIAKIREEKQAIYEVEKAHKSETEAVKDKIAVKERSFKSFDKEFSALKTQFDAEKKTATERIYYLNLLKDKFELLPDELDKVNVEINKQQDKVNKYLEKSSKEAVKTQKETWVSYNNELKVALSTGEISQQEYNQKISTYLTEHANELKSNTELKTQIESVYYAGVKKLQSDEEKEAKRIASEKKKITKEEEKDYKASAKAYEDRVKAEIEAQVKILEGEGKLTEAKKLQLTLQENEYRKEGLSETEITKWKNTEILKIEEEAFSKRLDLAQKINDVVQQNSQAQLSILEKQKQSEINNIEITVEKFKLSESTKLQMLKQLDTEYYGKKKQLEDESVKNYMDGVNMQITALKQQGEQMIKAGNDRIQVEKFIADSTKQIVDNTTSYFIDKELEKQNALQQTLDSINAVEAKLAENQAKQKELEAKQNESRSGQLPLMEGFKPLGTYALGGETPHFDQWQASTGEIENLKKEEKNLLEESNKLKAEAKTLEEELMTAKNNEKTATESLTKSLGSAATAITNFSNNLANQKPSSPSTGGNEGTGGGTPATTGTGTGSNLSNYGTSVSDMGNSSGMNYSGMYAQEAIGQAPESRVKELNQSYSSAYYGTSDPAERKIMQAQYASYAKGMGYSPEEALKIGFDNPSNDSLMESIGGEYVKAMMKNMQDAAMYHAKGMVKGLHQTSNNISNVNNSTSSSVLMTNNKYFLGDANITNSMPAEVKKNMENVVSWQMASKLYKRRGR